MTSTVAVLPFGPVSVLVEPVSVRVVVRVAVLPFGPVSVACAPVALRSTTRDMLLPFGPVVLDDTSPRLRSTSRVAVLPLAPVMVVWRSRAIAGDSAASENAAATARTRVERDWRDISMAGLLWISVAEDISCTRSLNAAAPAPATTIDDELRQHCNMRRPERAAAYTGRQRKREETKRPMSLEPLVLLVDDDAELSEMVGELLRREGWRTHAVLTGGDAERAIAELQPEIVLVDVMLPDANGFDLCRRWRAQHPALGLVMLTARGDPIDRVLGLEIGADDYLAKPFEARELVARVRALMRRTAPGRGEAPLLRFRGMTIDLVRREVQIESAGAAAAPLALTSAEFKLLVALARSPGQPLSREQLSAAVQAGDYRPLDRTVDVQVARLRRRLREVSPGAEWIDTVRGEGYVFVPRG